MKGFVGAALCAEGVHVLDLAAESVHSSGMHSSGIRRWLNNSKMVLSCACVVVFKCS